MDHQSLPVFEKLNTCTGKYFKMDHQIFNEIECHPSTVLTIEHLLTASPQLEIYILKLDFYFKIKFRL